MRNEIFVNVGPRETRVAVRESDHVVELHIERSTERGVVGGIYKGRVTRVLPGMQAAFVDIGLERAGFLYVADYRSDLDDVDLDDEDGNANGNGGGSGRRRASAAQRGVTPQIQDLLEEGREILVQVAKEPLGTKGARITSRISLAGRHLVLMPSVSRVGVSRRIESDRERRRLRAIVEKHRTNQELGFIVRTVSHGVSEADIKADVDYLTELWGGIQRRREETVEVPALVHEEPSLHLRILRDLATHETKQIVVDDAEAYGEMQDFVHRFMAAPRPKIVHYKGDKVLFDNHRIEGEIEEALGIKVWLKSGGYLVINQSEALTAVDVNTGRFTGGKSRNLEETILKTNLEAVREIVHQVRLRNIGGLIILDLIDMELAANREKVYRALLEALREDKAKVNLLKISELGLIEMTRKRTRENLVQALGEPCPDCEGRGYIQSGRTTCHKIFRELPKAAGYLGSETLLLKAHPDVATRLENEEAVPLHEVEQKLGRRVVVRGERSFHREQFEIVSGP
jgi:ribonuclease G